MSRKRAAPAASSLARDLHSRNVMTGRWRTDKAGRCSHLEASIRIAAPVGEVFARWSRVEDFPRVMESVRRTKRIDERCVLWDADILGRQVVWEARILESVPGKRIRWTSRSGAYNAGEVRFEPLAEDRTLLCVEIEYRPRGLIERLGASLGLVDFHVRRDLELFRRFVERNAQRAAA
jgi:uncharacterized membrane protein